MYYFSYGSNMSSKRLFERIKTAIMISTGILDAHVLKFHKVGLGDGTAKCDAYKTDCYTDKIYGVVFDIPYHEKQTLDQIEGLGKGYEEKKVHIKTPNGSTFEAYTYYASHINPNLKPFTWYKEHVLRGAREHKLPADYIGAIEVIESITDSNKGRHAKELAIYC